MYKFIKTDEISIRKQALIFERSWSTGLQRKKAENRYQKDPKLTYLSRN